MMNSGFHRHRILLLCLVLTLATLSLFWRVQHHGFVNFDDDLYVTANPRVQAGLTVDGIIWAFTTIHASNWHPLTWLSHMLDCHLFGLSPGAHHFTNVLLHIANTLLLFLAFRWMTHAVWKSAFVAALFALHPLHVESVAWIAERKDLLSTFFWLLTMGLYLHYVKRPGYTRYLLVFVSFSFGLMAKPMLVTLPFVLLLLDYWPLGRLELVHQGLTTQKSIRKHEIYWPKGAVVLRLVLEKIPLLSLTALSSVVTFLAQRSGGALESLGTMPLNVRLTNAFVTYMRYVEKTIWPHDLAVFYPHPGPNLPLWQVAGAVLSLLAITLLVLRAVRSHPHLITGWLWYLGTLVPVIGIVQVGAHAMADRYTYVPLIGLFIVMAWGLPDLLPRRPHGRFILTSSALVVIIGFMICSSLQVRCWQNSSTLFQHTLDVTTNNWLAHNNMGLAVASGGDSAGALAHYRQSLRINPKNAQAHNNLGIALVQHKSPREAGLHFEAALHLKPDFAEAHYNLGGLLLNYGALDDAVFHYHQAVQNEPDDPQIHNNMANALLRRGDVCEAISHYREALRLEPESAATLQNLEVALTMQRTPG